MHKAAFCKVRYLMLKVKEDLQRPALPQGLVHASVRTAHQGCSRPDALGGEQGRGCCLAGWKGSSGACVFRAPPPPSLCP